MSAAGAAPAEEEGRFTAEAGVELAFRSWRAEQPRAALLLVHGLGEHGARYAPVAGALARAGIDVHAFDLPGHGRSPGRRGHVESFARLTEAVIAFRSLVPTLSRADLPLFLFGHSLGGLIALRTVQEFPGAGWQGLALSAPALGVAMPVPAWKRLLGRAVSRLAPRLTLDNGIDPGDVSRDPAVVQAYRDDPLVHGRISARLYTEMSREMGVATGEAAALRHLPTLWLVPTGDRICDATATTALAGSIPGEGHTVIRYEGAYHEVLNDTVRARVVRDLTEWILARSG